MNTKKNYLNIIPVALFTFLIAFLFQSFSSVTKARQIVGLSIDANDNLCYIWYNDGTLSVGNTIDPNDYHSLHKYSLASKKSANDIVSIGINSDGHAYAWYDDGTVSVGTPSELDAYSIPYSYSLPSGKSVNSIVSIGISNNDHVYTWYKGGTVSVGTPYELDAHREPYAYPLPREKSGNNFVGIGIPNDNDYVYAWYSDTNSSFFEKSNPAPVNHYTDTYNYPSSNSTENSPFSVSLVRNLNSIASDFAPAFYKNRLMFSTFRTGNGNNNGVSNQVYTAMRSGAKLANPKPLIRTYRAVLNESDPSFTADGGRVAYVRNKNLTDGAVPYLSSNAKMNIYFADAFSYNDWKHKKPFTYNSRKYSNGYPHLTSQGTMLYFASNMPGGYGGFDIYVCKRKGDEWSAPINLGPQVNTNGDEISPFHTGNTLYFASDSYGGYGGFDIYKSINVNRIWTQGINMGKGINSSHDDYDFIYDTREEVAYFTSNRAGGVGYDDIYQAIEYAAAPPSSPAPFTTQKRQTVSTPDQMVVMVRDEATQLPLRGVRISLSACYGKTYTTDVNGLAILDRFDGDCAIRISKNGYGETTHRFPMMTQLSIEMTRLSPSYYPDDTAGSSSPEQMVLMVRDETTQLPLNNVRIDLSTCNGKIYTTDIHGLVILDPFDDNCAIRISKNGYETNVRHFPMMTQLTIEMTRLNRSYYPDDTAGSSSPQQMVLMVRDETTQLPLDDVRIDLSDCNGKIYTTDLNGLVILDWFDNNCNIRISKNGYEENIHRFPMTAQLGIKLKRIAPTHTYIEPMAKSPTVPVRTVNINTGSSTFPSPTSRSRRTPSRDVIGTYETKTSISYANETREVYDVQIGAFYTPRPEQFRSFENLGSIYSNMKGDMTVYKIGTFYNRLDAERARAVVRRNGYPDAFISTTVRSVPTTRALPSSYKVTSNPIVYKIQLGAFRNSNNAVFHSALHEHGTMQKTTRTDGMTVFLLGDYYSMSEAMTAQENAKNLGVSKAFIVKYRNGVKVD